MRSSLLDRNLGASDAPEAPQAEGKRNLTRCNDGANCSDARDGQAAFRFRGGLSTRPLFLTPEKGRAPYPGSNRGKVREDGFLEEESQRGSRSVDKRLGRPFPAL